MPSGAEDDPTYHAIWEDVKRCTGLGHGLTGSQRHSLYMQMACHARYGFSSHVGGNTWDLEAWRTDVEWSEGLSPGGKCGQSYGDVERSVVGPYLRGRIVNAFPGGREAWLVESLRAGDIELRQHIKTTQAYHCLVSSGRAPASWFPAHFLSLYFPIATREIGDEVCGQGGPGGSGSSVKLEINGACTTESGTLTSTSSGFTAGGTATIRAWYPDGREYTNLTRSSRVRSDGSIGWTWPCQGDPAGRYATEAVDDTSGASTGRVAFTIGGAGPTEPAVRVNAYDNYGAGAAGHAMCRGNPARPESMPGGTASQTFTVPAGVASLDAALVQIDPDNRVNAHASLRVNGTERATADAAAAGDTQFSFGAVAVSAGDQVTLAISFTASFGKIITVYTVGQPGGTFTASNSCPDGAPSLTTSATGLRAVLSGWSG